MTVRSIMPMIKRVIICKTVDLILINIAQNNNTLSSVISPPKKRGNHIDIFSFPPSKGSIDFQL